MTRVKRPAIMHNPLAIVITATSRWATWEISWASTASTSRSSSRRSSPVVAQTTAAFGLRPVANAFGTSVCAIGTLGVHGEHGDLVAEEVLAEQEPERDDQDEEKALQHEEEHADQDGVEDDEEEARHQHAGGQAPIRLDVVRDRHQLSAPPPEALPPWSAAGRAAASPAPPLLPPAPAPAPSSSFSAANSLSTWEVAVTLSSSF